MLEVLFGVVYFIGMFVYFVGWVERIGRNPSHGDVLPLTFQMVTWPVAFFWLCYKFNKGELK